MWKVLFRSKRFNPITYLKIIFLWILVAPIFAISHPSCLQNWTRPSVENISVELRRAVGLPLNSSCKAGRTLLVASHPFLTSMSHFSQYFFPFFSYLLWQQKAFAGKKCVETLSLNVTNKLQWKTIFTGTENWIGELVRQISIKFEIVPISRIPSKQSLVAGGSGDRTRWTFKPRNYDTSSTSSHEHLRWFFHPADAYLLGSTILKRDVCKPKRSSGANESLSLLILDRKMDRTFYNISTAISRFQRYIPVANRSSSTATKSKAPLTLSLSGSGSSKSSSAASSAATAAAAAAAAVSTQTQSQPSRPISISPVLPLKLTLSSVKRAVFENSTLFSQAKAMRDSDIVIAIHGAGLTNIAFMSPCSIVIEVFPELYYWPLFYGSLANQTGVLYYMYQASEAHTHYRSNPSKTHSNCSEVLKEARERKAQDKHAPPSSSTTTQSRGAGGKRHKIKPQRANKNAQQHQQQQQQQKEEHVSFDGGDDNTFCNTSPHCRYCSRTALSVELDVPLIEKILSRAVEDRKQCKKKFPWVYAPNRGA